MDILSQYIVPTGAQSICVGDLDLNGFNDIIVGHEWLPETDWGGISILRNQNWGYFILTDSLFAYDNENAVATAQLDSDPHPDIIFLKENTSNYTENFKIVFNNDINDTLILEDTQPYVVDYVSTGDVDGNGFNDIVFASNSGLYWGIFYNYGNRNFSSSQIHHVTNYNPSGLAVIDLNGDGRDDIVLGGQVIDVNFSLPSGFQRLELDAEGYTAQVAITDFDQDGYKDILCNSGFASNVLIMYKNNGNNTFQKMPDFVFQPLCYQFFVADFNNDGLPDVLYQNADETGYILWYNQGNFQLADSQFVSVPFVGGEASRSFCCADLDNNGYNDIITARFSIYRIHNIDIRFNDGNGNFSPNPIVGTQNHDPVLSSTLKNYPNPFQDQTVFNFFLKETSIAELSVYDLQGKFIACLINQKMEGGPHSRKWRGLDNGSQPCKPGAYIAYLKVNGKICKSIKVIKT